VRQFETFEGKRKKYKVRCLERLKKGKSELKIKEWEKVQYEYLLNQFMAIVT